MTVRLLENGAGSIIVGVPATRILRTAEDVIGLIETCFNHHVRTMLLFAENLPVQFFDLSSGEVGVILQKLRQYGIRLAVVAAPGLALSSHFQALMIEERKGRDFGLFANQEAAEAWLLTD